MGILIHIEGELIGLLASMAKLMLDDNYNVNIITKSDSIKEIIVQNIAELEVHIESKSGYLSKTKLDNIKWQVIQKEALSREKKYGETFSMIMSHDRGLGKGHIFNADRHPDTAKEWWSNEKKIEEILKEFMVFESIIKKYKPLLIIGRTHNKVLSLISRFHNIRYLSFGVVKYGHKQIWIENEYYQNKTYIDKVKENVEKFKDLKEFLPIDYMQEQASAYKISKVTYSYLDAFQSSLRRLPMEILKKLTGYYKKHQGYKFLGWYPAIFRRPFAYNYFKKYGKKPNELKDYKLIYFAMHREPEIALLSISPELNNSMEIISWISKSLSVDTLIVIKEEPISYGIRSKRYYDKLRKINNVVLACPEITSWQWIKTSYIVATITGTVGIEAVYFEKPVLSFGKHQIINHLPTVRNANSYETTRDAIKDLLSLQGNNKKFKISKESLYRAQMDVAFEMPGIEKIYKSRELHPDLAEIAVKNLKQQYGL